jgi:hypothetical protein
LKLDSGKPAALDFSGSSAEHRLRNIDADKPRSGFQPPSRFEEHGSSTGGDIEYVLSVAYLSEVDELRREVRKKAGADSVICRRSRAKRQNCSLPRTIHGREQSTAAPRQPRAGRASRYRSKAKAAAQPRLRGSRNARVGPSQGRPVGRALLER